MLGHYLMTVGGCCGRTDIVEIVSLYPDEHPLPECMQHLDGFPYRHMEGAGAAIMPGMYIFQLSKAACMQLAS